MDRYLIALKDLLSDPTSNLAATAIGLAIVALFTIILILILLIWAVSSQPTKRKPNKQRGQAEKGVSPGLSDSSGKESTAPAPRRAPMSVKSKLLTGVLILGSIAVAYGGTSSNEYCSSVCHSMSDATDSWADSAHVSVACVRCHEGTPVVSAPNAVALRLQSAYLEFTETQGPGTPVPGARCLSCHKAIVDEIVVGPQAVAMSHAEVVEAGMDCADCHGTQGHRSDSLAVGMSACIVCHDGTDASSECTLCHPDGAEASIRITTETFGQPVQLPERPSCGGCHSEDTCDACHGIRMPHPEGFEDPALHAREGAFSGKTDVCYRCHTTIDCGVCHSPFSAHGSDWDRRHRSQDSQWCRACHTHPDDQDMCAYCH